MSVYEYFSETLRCFFYGLHSEYCISPRTDHILYQDYLQCILPLINIPNFSVILNV